MNDQIQNFLNPRLSDNQSQLSALSPTTASPPMPPWNVSTIKFEILTKSQQGDLKKLNTQLDKISKMLQTTQNILNATLGTLINILKAIEDPLALLFQLLAAEMLKLEAAFNSSLGIYMLDDISEQIRIKVTLFGTTFDASNGLNIAGGINSSITAGTYAAQKFLYGDTAAAKMQKQTIPTPAEVGALQIKAQRLNAFVGYIKEYNDDLLAVINGVTNIYDTAYTIFKQFKTSITNPASNVIAHYDSTVSKVVASTDKTIGTTTFAFPSIYEKILSLYNDNSGANYSSSDYVGKIVDEIKKNCFVAMEPSSGVVTNKFIDVVVGATNSQGNTPSKADAGLLNYNYSTFTDPEYLKKVPVATAGTITGTQGTAFTQEQTNRFTSSDQENNARFALMGAALYEFEKVMADKALSSDFARRVQIYAIIEKYFKSRLQSVDNNANNSSMTTLPYIIPISEKMKKSFTSITVNEIAALNDSVTAVEKPTTTGSLKDKTSYKTDFLKIEPGPFLDKDGKPNPKNERIETQYYGLDLDVQLLQAINAQVLETVGASQVPTGESSLVTQISNKIQGLIGALGQSDSYTATAQVSNTKDSKSTRQVITTPEARASDAAASIRLTSAKAAQVQLLETSIAKQIDTITNFQDIVTYKQKYYTSMLPSLYTSLDDKFKGLQTLLDDLKQYATAIEVNEEGIIGMDFIQNVSAGKEDPLVLYFQLIIQAINSIKATFQPFLLNMIAVTASQQTAKDNPAEAAVTVKNLLSNELDWNKQVVGSDAASIASKVEAYLDQFKKLIAGQLIGPDPASMYKLILDEGNSPVIDFNGLPKEENPFVLYQDGFVENTYRNAVKDVLCPSPKGAENIAKKKEFVRYYTTYNINSLMLQYNIPQPQDFLKQNNIFKKIDQIKRLIGTNIASHANDSFSLMGTLLSAIASLNSYLCSNDDSTTAKLPPEIKKQFDNQKAGIQQQLDMLNTKKTKLAETLYGKVKKIDYLNNTFDKSNKSWDGIENDLIEVNKLIDQLGGYKYDVNKINKTIKLTTTQTVGELNKQIDSKTIELNTINGKQTNAGNDIIASSSTDNPLLKIDTQIAILNQKITELGPDSKQSQDLSKNELAPLKDLRNKVVNGQITSSAASTFLTNTLTQLSILNDAQRELDRISDDLSDVTTAMVNSTGIIKLQNGDTIGYDEYNNFKKFILTGDVKSLVDCALPKASADYIKNQITLIAFDSVGNVDLKDLKNGADYIFTNTFAGYPPGWSRKVINPDSVTDYLTSGFYQKSDSNFPSYNGNFFFKNVFFVDINDGKSFDFVDNASNVSIGALYKNYVNHILSINLNGSENSVSGKDTILIKLDKLFTLFYLAFTVIDQAGIATEFAAIDLSTKINYHNYKSYLKTPAIINMTDLVVGESPAYENDNSLDVNILSKYYSGGYKQTRVNLEASNPAFYLPITPRAAQLAVVKAKIDTNIQQLANGTVPEGDDNRSFFRLSLRSKNEWVEQIIAAFRNEDDKRRPIFPDDISKGNPMKAFTAPTPTASANSYQLVNDQDIAKIMSSLGDLTGGVNSALSSITPNTELAVIFYIVTACDIVALLNKISPIYDMFIAIKEGKPTTLQLKFQDYKTRIEKIFSELEANVNALYDDIAKDVKTVVDTANDFRNDPVKAAKNMAKSFISFECSEDTRIQNALQAAVKLPPELAGGITHKWVSLGLKDIPPFDQLGQLSLGLSGLLKGLARPKIGLATVVQKLLDNLNRKINLLKKVVQGINLMIEFLNFIGTFQIDCGTLELENVRSVDYIEQALRTSEQFPTPFGVSTDDDQMFIAGVVFVMPQPLLPIFRKFIKIGPSSTPVPFAPTAATAGGVDTNSATAAGDTTGTGGNSAGVTLVI